MDLDGDGVISLYELEYFYEDQVTRMEALGIEAMSFEDCACSVLDLVKPKIDGKVSLGDLKRCGLAHIFFNTFLNLDKYVEYEQRDPFASLKVRIVCLIIITHELFFHELCFLSGIKIYFFNLNK